MRRVVRELKSLQEVLDALLAGKIIAKHEDYYPIKRVGENIAYVTEEEFCEEDILTGKVLLKYFDAFDKFRWTEVEIVNKFPIFEAFKLLKENKNIVISPEDNPDCIISIEQRYGCNYFIINGAFLRVDTLISILIDNNDKEWIIRKKV